MEEFYSGSKVKILGGIHTEPLWGWSLNMDKFVGTNQIIQYIKFDSFNNVYYAIMDGYKWDLRDLQLVNNDNIDLNGIDISVGCISMNFDPNNLDIPR